MAHGSHGGQHVVPTAINLHEPKFPFPNGQSSSFTQDTKLKPGTASSGIGQKEDMIDTPQDTSTPQYVPPEPQVSPARRLSRAQTDIGSDPRPPMLQKLATDPSPSHRRQSLLGRVRSKTEKKRLRLNRQTALMFDPYSSESSSSDEEETTAHASIDDHAEEQPKEKKTIHTSWPFSKFKIAHEHFSTKGCVSKRDGRLKLSINETVNSGYFAKTLGAGLKKHFKGDEANSPATIRDAEAKKITPEDDIMEDLERRVKLNIVVIVIGSRGDIQPFLKIGKILKEDYGHRVRIATHPAFKKFVEEDSGLEFFSVGGDPSELMAFMVKNPGLIPSVDTIREGEIGRRRAAMYEMFQGMWRACINSTDDEDDHANLKMMGDRHPFVADAIIANPPSFAPPHIAERLGIPLHMMFTFPYTPTFQFPHPLANIKASNIDPGYTNFMSYPLVEMMTWQGLGDLINRFRAKTLWLDEVSTLWAPGQLYRLRVPYTYMWSPGLVPKPKDWGPEIDISGFVFLDLASSFKPPEDLVEFLNAGEPPVYIGFGSIVVDDPDKFTELIFEAVKLAGVRALVSKGWGGFGGKNNAPDNIFMLDNTPHDWLFPRVSAVVHHGGAGTTAIGLKCAKPTMIVPFFGDQPFWGGMVSKAKAGAHKCIPYKKLTAERLAEGIKQCLTDEARSNAQEIADSISKEGDGALNAVRSFHRSLPLQGELNMRCQVIENRCATWKLKNTSLRLCPLAAELLVEWKKIRWNDLRLLRIYEWNDFGGPGEPVTGIWGAVVSTMEDVFTGVGLVPFKMARSVKTRERYYEKRYRKSRKQKHMQATLAKTNGTHANDNGPANGHTMRSTDKATTQSARPKIPKRNESTLSNLTEPEEWLAEELAEEAGHGFKKTGGAIIKSPMFMTLAVAQGFHNAPRLYGDDTVRRPPRISGFHSGLRAGRDEFVYGIHDGFTGIWRQPIRGAKNGGILGFLEGFGMGIGGFVLKNIAAAAGPPAYFMKGLHEERQKKHQPTGFIRRARIVQGQKELADLGPRAPRRSGSRRFSGEREGVRRQEVEMQVSRRWESVQTQITAEKTIHKSGLKAALMARSQKKEGMPYPRRPHSRTSSKARPASSRRSEPSNEQLQPKKAISMPIQQAEQVNQPTQGIKSRETAPETSMAWKEKTKKRDKLEAAPYDVKIDAKGESTSKQDVPNMFEGQDHGPVSSNGAPIESSGLGLQEGLRKEDIAKERQRGG